MTKPHDKDPRTGARISFLEVRYGEKKEKVLYRGIIRRGGREWKFAAKDKATCEGKVEAKRLELEREGVSAAQLSAEEKHDAAKARAGLADGETLESAMKELQLVRDVLGTGKALADALEDVRAARKWLDGRATFEAAAGYWAIRHPAGQSITLGDGKAAYMRRLAKKSPGYYKTVDYRLNALVESLGATMPLVSIGPESIETTMTAWKLSDASWNDWVGMYATFFKWAVDEYKLPVNPAAGLKKRELEEREIDFLRVDDVEKLLRACERVAPEYAPAVAILFFGGLRPTELTGQYALDGSGVIGGLDWECVDVDGTIFLAGRNTKNRRQRKVPIPANLKAWLDAYGGEKKGRLVPNPQAWKEARKAIVEAAGVAWPQDFARHSFACYRFELDGDRARLEAAMGHAPASRLLESNYKRPVRHAEAERYFGIMPMEKDGGK